MSNRADFYLKNLLNKKSEMMFFMQSLYVDKSTYALPHPSSDSSSASWKVVCKQYAIGFSGLKSTHSV